MKVHNHSFWLMNVGLVIKMRPLDSNLFEGWP